MTWQPLRTHDQSKEMVLVALVRDSKPWRVSEASYNGFGFYDVGGYACHWATHWMPMPKVGHTPVSKPCILNCDSPSYPPTPDEYRQCGCETCLREIQRFEALDKST